MDISMKVFSIYQKGRESRGCSFHVFFTDFTLFIVIVNVQL